MLDVILFLSFLLLLNSFFSISEFSIASSRKLKLEHMVLEGNINAQKVLELSSNRNLKQFQIYSHLQEVCISMV